MVRKTIYEHNIDKQMGIEEELSFGTDNATTRYPMPIYITKFSINPSLNRKENAPIGSTGGGTQAVSVSEGLPEYAGSLDGRLIDENAMTSFVGYSIGDWIDYFTGEIKIMPNATLKQVVTFDANSTDVDNTTEANSAGGTPFGAFPASETTSDALMIGTCIPIASIYIDIATAGVGGTITEQYYNGSWTGLSGVVDNTSELTVDGNISWTMPTDIVRYKPTFSGITGLYLYWYRLLVGSTYATNPTINQITAEYSNNSFTYEFGIEGANPEYTLLKGFRPTKRVLKITTGEDIEVTYDWIAKTQTLGTTGASTNGLPPRTGSTTGTNGYKRPLRAFKGSGDVTVAFSNAPTGFDTTTANDCIRSIEITEDSNAKGVGMVGLTASINSIMQPNPMPCNIRFSVVKRNDDFKNWAYGDSNAAAGQTDLTLTLEKNITIASSLQADPGTSDTAITLTSAEAGNLHPGDVIKIVESGQTTRYRMVTSISSGTVNLLQALTSDFSTAADVYHNGYEKYTFTDLWCPDPESISFSERGGEIVETYGMKPHSYTHYVRQVDA